jgi:ParB-like chromosome segregation protein Spo0J
MKIDMMPITAIRPYEKNPRHNDEAVSGVARSIREFGFQQPIVVDQDNIIVVGHTRYRAAKELGLESVPVVRAELSREKLQAYRIADNKLNELAIWDDALLIEELSEIVARGDEQLTGFSADEIRDLLADPNDPLADNPYTGKIETPVYTPKGERPPLRDLLDDTHAETLKLKIYAANISDEAREFLLKAADRHRVFDYHNIAEYYCHADAETQALMEESALVIIDFDKAVEQGYVKLNDDLKDLYSGDYPDEP